MKYDKVPSHYRSPYMKQVAEKLNVLQMTKAERENYSYYQKQLYNDRDELQAAEARGIEKGKEELIKIMITNGNSIEMISNITGLSINEIKKLTSY